MFYWRMRVIFLKHKAIATFTALAMILLAALAFLAAAAGSMRYDNLLLAVPQKTGTAGLNTQKLEEFCEEEFLLTYEIKQEKNAKAVNSSHVVTLIGTNAAYPDIIGYVMLDGGFITKAAWEAAERHAVLNETAAFKLFGSKNISGKTLRIGGETWFITGVIQDKDADNANIYAPSSVTGGSPQSLMSLTGGSITQVYAVNALKSLGIRDTAYDFYNLSSLASLYGEFFLVAWQAAVCLLAILAAAIAAIRAQDFMRSLKVKLKKEYIADIAAKNRGELFKPAGYAILSVMGVAAALAVSVRILDTCLGWYKITPVADIAMPDFALRLAWLKDYYWMGMALFIAFLFATITLFILACTYLRRPAHSLEKAAAIKMGVIVN